MNKIAVIGAGKWGQALKRLISKNHDCVITNRNYKDIPNFVSQEEALNSEYLIFAIPSQATRKWLEEHFFNKRPTDVVFANRTGNELHPTQKPVALYQKWARLFGGETVCDPFMGSGTTLMAAKLDGRHAIGIELEEKHWR